MLAEAILKTLIYSGNFDYPLNFEEICRWLIAERAADKAVARGVLKKLVAGKKIESKSGYYFLPGQQKTINLRLQREKFSREKLLVAEKTAEKLRAVPFIKLIGVTGALSMNNADKNDDIDLMIIAAKDTLWLARLLIVLFSPILGIKRRKPKDRSVKDKICFNLFLDEADLEIKEKNLFTAHEICQIKPLYNKDHAYERFLAANDWIKNYLPNATPTASWRPSAASVCLLSLLNRITFYLQYFYMKSKITNEKISLHQAFFHPKDLSSQILKGLDKKKNLWL